ncbi:MAG TPA: DUF4440 domain-containing protein, partial [Chitinophagaceae bacterium]
MKRSLAIPLIIYSMLASAQSRDDQAIRNLLQIQAKAWSDGNVRGFMEGYWKNDSLMFIGQHGISWGWEQALSNYLKSYPDTAAMGKLSFDILLVRRLSGDYYYVVGKW